MTRANARKSSAHSLCSAVYCFHKHRKVTSVQLASDNDNAAVCVMINENARESKNVHKKHEKCLNNAPSSSDNF